MFLLTSIRLPTKLHACAGSWCYKLNQFTNKLAVHSFSACIITLVVCLSIRVNQLHAGNHSHKKVSYSSLISCVLFTFFVFLTGRISKYKLFCASVLYCYIRINTICNYCIIFMYIGLLISQNVFSIIK